MHHISVSHAYGVAGLGLTYDITGLDAWLFIFAFFLFFVIYFWYSLNNLY